MSGKMKMYSSSGPGPYKAQFWSLQSHSIHSYSCPIDLGFQDDIQNVIQNGVFKEDLEGEFKGGLILDWFRIGL